MKYTQSWNAVGSFVAVNRCYADIHVPERKPATHGATGIRKCTIVIRCQSGLMLNDGRYIHGKGYATVTIRNVPFMDDAEYYVRILPPRCDIGS